MANSSLIESSSQPKPGYHLLGESYKLSLTRALNDLVAETRKPEPKLSPFLEIFYELMQARVDPPLETIWVYSALTFRGFNHGKGDFLERVLGVKRLFQVVFGCTASCGPSKSVVLLAPVVSELFKLVKELLASKDLGEKRLRKVGKEVRSLTGEVLGYMSLCCYNRDSGWGVNGSELVVPLSDLVRVWMDGKEEERGLLKSVLPLVSNEMCQGIEDGGFDLDHIAGIVIAELFLLKLSLDLRVGNRGSEVESELKLSLDLRVGNRGSEVESELRSWVVGSLTGCQSLYLFDIILTMLLEPTLPVTSLLSSDNETLLRSVLYDAVVLVEYSFLGSEKTVNLEANKARSLLLKRLIITCESLEFFRKRHNQKKAISYNASFSNSRYALQIIKHVASQIGMDEETSKLKGSSPRALLKWLVDLDNQGVKLFDDSVTKYRAKLILQDVRAGDDKLSSKSADSSRPKDDFLFYIDNKGEQETDSNDNDSMSAAFVAAAHTMHIVDDKERKRKGSGSAGDRKRSKFVRDDQSDSDGEGISFSGTDGSSSDSEVDNPSSDEDV